MTPKQQRFVDEYLVDLNGKQAAIRCGYSAKTAESQASRLLRSGKVAAAVEAARAKLADAFVVKQADVLRELWRLAMVNVADVFDEKDQIRSLHSLPESLQRAIAGRKVDKDGNVEVKAWDKVKCLELLGRHLGMFKDKVEHELGEKTLEQLVMASRKDTAE